MEAPVRGTRRAAAFRRRGPLATTADVGDTPTIVEAVIYVPDADACARGAGPGGLSLLERQLRQLRALGATPATLVVAAAASTPALTADVRELGAAVRVVAPGTDPDPFAALAAAGELPADFLFVSADHVVDARVLRAARDAPPDTLIHDEHGRPLPIGRVTAAAVACRGAALPEAAHGLPMATLDPYAPELRGVVPPYVLRVRSADDRRRAWRLLLNGVQKRGLDLPGEYFDSPFENALVRAAAPTRITPNQITLLTLVLAGGVGLLFLRGALAMGVVFALVVGILDGVDGKLARLKLATSRLGELEHVGDFLYENFWYGTLALHFQAATGLLSFRRFGLALIACDLADNLLYGVVKARTGRLLDELSPFDRRFRRIAGRRNVYVWILIGGVALGHAAGAYVAIVGWALVTVLVHAARTVRWTLPRTAQVSLIDPAAGTFVNEK